MTVENYTCLCDAKVRPMHEHESEMFMNMFLMERVHKEKGTEPPEKLRIEMRQTLPFQILEQRLEQSNAKVTLPLLVFIAALCETPGMAVMWAWTLSFMALQTGGKEIDFEFWTTYFPMGLPTDEEAHRVWDAQKESGKPLGNNLDDPDFWPKVPG